MRCPAIQPDAPGRYTLRLGADSTGQRLNVVYRDNIDENAIATARTSFQRVDATREARVYAEAALGAEQKKLESGKSTSFEVLRLQRDLTSARSAEIRALADYNIALAQIALNEGTTLDRRHVTLEIK